MGEGRGLLGVRRVLWLCGVAIGNLYGYNGKESAKLASDVIAYGGGSYAGMPKEAE